MRRRPALGRSSLAATVAFAVLLTLAPTAAADDPAADKARVDQEIAEIEGELVESTEAVALAADALRQVDLQLVDAREALAQAQAELDVAEADDARLAIELATAQDDERAAEGAIVSAQSAIDENRAAVGALARAAYQGGSMSQVTALLDAQTLTDFSQRVTGVQTAIRAQDAVRFELANDRAELAEGQAALEAVRERVADARAAAAALLVEKTRLEDAAVAAETEVAALHGERAQVLADAQTALAADEAEYAALKAERDRIEADLRRRAEAAQQSSTTQWVSNGTLYRPVLGRVTSSYGMRRHPITGVYKLHDGTDFGAACGTVIRAAASGTVIRKSYAGGYGNMTIIEHGMVAGAHLATSYSHQSRFAVSVGEHVDRGQVIGYVGTTGFSTGCHLHFMVYRNGSTTDPMNYL